MLFDKCILLFSTGCRYFPLSFNPFSLNSCTDSEWFVSHSPGEGAVQYRGLAIYLAERVPLVRLLWLKHPEGMVIDYERMAGRRLGDCDLKCDDLYPKLAWMNSKDAHQLHEAIYAEKDRRGEGMDFMEYLQRYKSQYFSMHAILTDMYRVFPQVSVCKRG